MTHVPFIFPFSFIVMVRIIFFAGVYGVAESAVRGEPTIDGGSVAVLQAVKEPASPYYAGHQTAAVFVCPLQ